MLQFLYSPKETRESERRGLGAGYLWPVRLLLWVLLLLTGTLSLGAVFCWLWLMVNLPAAPSLPLLGLVGLALIINALAGLCYLHQSPYVAVVMLAGSVLATWLVIRALLLCAFLFAFLF